MNIIHETPILEAKTSGGKPKFWQGVIYQKEVALDAKDVPILSSSLFTEVFSHVKINPVTSEYFVAKRWWQEGSVVQECQPTPIKSKNVGRANQTTPRDQAFAEMDSMVAYQKRQKGYCETGETSVADTLNIVKGMLAHPYSTRGVDKATGETVVKKRKVDWARGFRLQPKYDGLRLGFDGTNWWTRGNLPPADPRIVEHLKCDTQGYVFDGELILPWDFDCDGLNPFQLSVKAAKKYRPELTPNLEFRIFDITGPGTEDMTFDERFELLKTLVKACGNPQVKTVYTTEVVHSEAEFLQHHLSFIEKGYEGTMMRTPTGLYKPGHRSDDLLKHKDFDDAEFKIIAFESGDKGKEIGAIKFICETQSGVEFTVTPNLPLEERYEMFKRGNDFIGSDLTVKFQGYTEEGKPRFPKGIIVRDKALQG